MNNIDKETNEFVHLYVAIRRRKDNKDLKEICFRQIIKDKDIDLEIIKKRLSQYEGAWRIHKTINKRCVKTAVTNLQIELLRNPEKCFRLESEYKTLLMKPEAKAERNFLLDIDSKCEVLLKNIIDYISKNELHTKDFTETPNGYHMIISKENFDTRNFESKFPDVTIQRDGYIFIERIIN